MIKKGPVITIEQIEINATPSRAGGNPAEGGNEMNFFEIMKELKPAANAMLEGKLSKKEFAGKAEILKLSAIPETNLTSVDNFVKRTISLVGRV